MNLNEFRNLLKNNEEEAINLWNDLFRDGLDVNQASQKMGFSWGSVRDEIYALGYEKPRNKLICKIGEQGEKIMNNNTNNKLTEDEILFLKELYKNRTETKEDINIKAFSEYKQKSFVIAKELSDKLNKICEENYIYKARDIINKIVEIGLNSYIKNINN